ncbi:MAG: hypothetical protein QOK90_08445 [Nitrososphaeraceae archaeon]|jgi:hypothetical protein|nr:hypothetical protein [Nitrososphaeraceae archaeon]MDW3627153.1 hypothetical protein [Nitrososphaeraceae archaeon]
MAGISDLLVLGIIAGGIYYAASTGMLNNILPQQQQYVNQLPTEASLEDDMIEDIQDEINKGKKKELYNLIL